MNRDWRPLALVTQVGLTIAVSIVVSLLLGIWIDDTIGTKPWATLAFALIGIIAGSISVYRMVSEAIAAATQHREIEDSDERPSRKRRKENE